jgi:hypothetical protein
LHPNVFKMKLKLVSIFLIVFVLQSCQNKNEKQLLDTQKDLKRRELVYEKINKGWLFDSSSILAQNQSTTWQEWRLFLTELNQKPTKIIGAFQKKATELSKKAMALNDNIPVEFNNPQIKARIATLITKVRLLDLFIHLKNIPEEKVLALVTQINEELDSLQNQMNKIVQKSKIPLEEGESELRMMMDSARAIPNVEPDPNLPRVE